MKHMTAFRYGDRTRDELVEIAYYIKTSQAPGMSEPNVSDAIRYAVAIAAAQIRNEASQGRNPGEE